MENKNLLEDLIKGTKVFTTKVFTTNGPKSLAELYKSDDDIYVYSFNLNTKRVEVSKVKSDLMSGVASPQQPQQEAPTTIVNPVTEFNKG